MSGPPSDGRPSVSSEPSATSSRTLNSRLSSGYGEDYDSWEGSSGMGPSETRAADLEPASVEETDFAQRRHRVRRSGGFLLDSMFTTGPANRQHARERAYGEHGYAHHGHRRPRGHSSTEQLEIDNGGARDAMRAPSPLRGPGVDEQGAVNHDLRLVGASAPEHDGQLHPPKMRNMARDVSAVTEKESLHPNDASRLAMDPTQIIDLALKLGESRRRNLSAGQLIAPQASGARRVASIGVQDGGHREPSTGGSLRQYLNEQRRASRNMSPLGGKHKKIVPSEDTLARAKKFRDSVELRMEYLRLLEYLPPLKPDVYAPGNYIVKTENVPGSPHAFLSRIPSYAGKVHDLGRPYNPLQYLRDRRTRARERKSLHHMPEDFSDVHKVRDWVSRVQDESRHPVYRRQNGVVLPDFHEEHAEDQVANRNTKHRSGWTFTVEELIADAVWLEQEGNKDIIEDRFGHRIFPAEESKKQDFLQPRSSKEYPTKRRKSWVDAVSINADTTAGDESDPASERGRKRKLLPAFRAESPRHAKHGWKGSVSRSRPIHSDISDSESDALKPLSRDPLSANTDPTINTGALGLHLKGTLEQEAKEAKTRSPSVTSPDTPDKWGTGFRTRRDSSTPRSSMDVPGYDGLVKAVSHHDRGLKPPPVNRSLSFDPSQKTKQSSVGPDTTPPRTPLHSRNMSRAEGGSPPPSNRGGDVKSSLKSKLGAFRSENSLKGSRRETFDSEPSSADRKSPKRHPGEDGLGTAVKSLLSHRHNQSVSSVNNPKGNNKDAKDPSSAVTRFFKGVKNERSKVGEFIFKRDRPAEDSDSESLDTDLGGKSDMDQENTRHGLGRSTTLTATDSVQPKHAGRYHVELPTFRNLSDQDTRLSDDPITRQSRARANSRSKRFDRLAPPPMDLGSMSSKSSPNQSRSHTPELQGRPRNFGLLYPDDPPRGLSVTSIPESTFSDTSGRMPQHRASRHWSITDDDPANPHAFQRRRTITTAPGSSISSSDIARIRALFLSSGVKAREIARRAHEKRADPPPFLTDAANAANASLIPVPRMEEHALAARILVRNLEASTTALQHAAESYREHTIQDLTAAIGALKSRVESDLLPRVREAGDEAVRITSEVSASAPLSVKQLSDELDKMVRARRRRRRWVRRVGWMLVEWSLLGIMWWVWLVVVCLRFVRRVLGAGVGVVRWLVWI